MLDRLLVNYFDTNSESNASFIQYADPIHITRNVNTILKIASTILRPQYILKVGFHTSWN